jgi:hypothetical protein
MSERTWTMPAETTLSESEIQAKIDEFYRLDGEIEKVIDRLDSLRSERRRVVRAMRESGMRPIDITRILGVAQTWVTAQLTMKHNYGERGKIYRGKIRGKRP